MRFLGCLFLLIVTVHLHAQSQTTATPRPTPMAPTEKEFRFNDGRITSDALRTNASGIVNNQNIYSLVPQTTDVNNINSNWQSQYGQGTRSGGQNRSHECSTTGGTSEADKQNCDMIRFVIRNPQERPAYAIDPKTEPLKIRADGVRNNPRAYVSAIGVPTASTGCEQRASDNTTEIKGTERCEIGKEVREGVCQRTLKATYTLQPYTGQPGAEVKYSKCNPPTVRGDTLTVQLSVQYFGTSETCASRGWGDRNYIKVHRRSCDGTVTDHGYDAYECSIPPTPISEQPPRNDAPCFTPAPSVGNCWTTTVPPLFVNNVVVPVFTYTWDDSLCAELRGSEVIISGG
jgi:hypothetical protein